MKLLPLDCSKREDKNLTGAKVNVLSLKLAISGQSITGFSMFYFFFGSCCNKGISS